jgi:hypothetical protein
MARWKLLFALAFVCLLCIGTLSAQDQPQAFGVNDYTVTTVTATAFYPDTGYADPGYYYSTSGSLGRYGGQNNLTTFNAAIDIPGGAVIDFIGLNSTTDTDAVLTAGLYNRHKDGTVDTVGTVNSTVHGWDTDLNASPIGFVWDGASGKALVLHVVSQSNPNLQFFGWVEVWWHRSVSPAPGTATFGDVPTNHPFFQFIEALAASGITGGCGAGNYCPDAPLTRGQMAVFLAKALGLHWPGAPGLAAPTHN